MGVITINNFNGSKVKKKGVIHKVGSHLVHFFPRLGKDS